MMTNISTPVREGFAPLAAHVSRVSLAELAGGVTDSFCIFAATTA